MQYFHSKLSMQVQDVKRGEQVDGVQPRIIELPNGAQAFPLLEAMCEIAPSVNLTVAGMIAGMMDSTMYNDDGEADMSPAWIGQLKIAAFLGRSFYTAFKGNPGDPDNARPALRMPSEENNVLVCVFRDNSGMTWTDGVLLDGLDNADGVIEFWRSTSSILPIGERQVARRERWAVSPFGDAAPVLPIHRIVVPNFEAAENDHVVDTFISVHKHMMRRRV